MKKFKFRLKNDFMEITEESPGVFKIVNKPKYMTQDSFTLAELKEYFLSADCPTLALVDPDRAERFT